MDTIAAIATSHGIGSIAVIRLSGPASLDIAEKLSKKDKLYSQDMHHYALFII